MAAAPVACPSYGFPVSVHSRTATVGEPAPDLNLTDQDGNEFHLAEAVAHGPVVLVFLRGFS
jgi:peroxiredoxin